jgi:hypothetical protein
MIMKGVFMYRIYKETNNEINLKKWGFKPVIDEDGAFDLYAVDMITGNVLTMLLTIDDEGLHLCHGAELDKDYEQGLSFDIEGKLVIGDDQ